MPPVGTQLKQLDLSVTTICLEKRQEGGSPMFSLSDDELTAINIKVVGIGGAGCNAVNTMIESGLSRVEFVVANTDLQALGRSMASYKIQLGPERARGLGAGAKTGSRQRVGS